MTALVKFGLMAGYSQAKGGRVKMCHNLNPPPHLQTIISSIKRGYCVRYPGPPVPRTPGTPDPRYPGPLPQIRYQEPSQMKVQLI